MEVVISGQIIGCILKKQLSGFTDLLGAYVHACEHTKAYTGKERSQ